MGDLDPRLAQQKSKTLFVKQSKEEKVWGCGALRAISNTIKRGRKRKG
jgi:hypothetical protein